MEFSHFLTNFHSKIPTNILSTNKKRRIVLYFIFLLCIFGISFFNFIETFTDKIDTIHFNRMFENISNTFEEKTIHNVNKT